MRAIVAVAVLVSGCAAPGVWVHGSKSQGEFESDRAQCVYEATAASANISNPLAQGMKQGELAQLCMQARGWSIQPQ